ncbi:hypothetical protein GCM10027440_09370 [Nocardiopsis coralliicola]
MFGGGLSVQWSMDPENAPTGSDVVGGLCMPAGLAMASGGGLSAQRMIGLEHVAGGPGVVCRLRASADRVDRDSGGRVLVGDAAWVAAAAEGLATGPTSGWSAGERPDRLGCRRRAWVSAGLVDGAPGASASSSAAATAFGGEGCPSSG